MLHESSPNEILLETCEAVQLKHNPTRSNLLELVKPPPQVPSPPHQFLVFVFLHLQFPLPFHADGMHLLPPRSRALHV